MSREGSQDSFIEKFVIAVILGALLMYGGTKIKDRVQEMASADMMTIDR